MTPKKYRKYGEETIGKSFRLPKSIANKLEVDAEAHELSTRAYITDLIRQGLADDLRNISLYDFFVKLSSIVEEQKKETR